MIVSNLHEAPWEAWSRGLRRSDTAAFAALFRTVYPDLLWYAEGLVGRDGSAEDLVQEAFVRLWEQRHGIDPERSVRTLLYVMVRRRAFNQQRDRKRRDVLLQQAATPVPSSVPPDHFSTRTIGRHLRAWVHELPERQREAFELSRFCGLSHDEIARVMKLSVHTVEKHISRALRHLRDRIRAFDPDLLQP